MNNRHYKSVNYIVYNKVISALETIKWGKEMEREAQKVSLKR